ncbi:MAG: HAMP domain-containing sensor histidine kinase [Solibacillus sp.]
MFRNKEIRRLAYSFSAITAVGAVIGFLIEPIASLLLLITCVLLGTVFFLYTRARYKRIAQISEQIDGVLHHDDQLFIHDIEEGELSILQHEITKMTVRIREQNEALQKEKVYLAESLADIAHQLRTPLTSATLILSLLQNEPNERKQKMLLRDSQKSFDQMDWLITSLLKISRLDAGIVTFKTETLHVKHLIVHTLQPFQIAMDLHNITAQLHIPEQITIQGDFDWLSEALQNIIKNCIESAGDDGTIQITCEENPLYTEITLHDSGPGFKKEDIPYLFERFYRGKNTSTAGYGIGLALSKTILTRQGGMVSAKNHEDGGALFTIRFPK